MIRCGKTGATILYGTKCAGCDCERADPLPAGRVMGFDLASGPDHTATATISRQRVGDSYEFRVEDIELFATTSREQAERMAGWQRKMDEAIWRSINVPPEHFNCRSRMDPRYGNGTAWTPPAQEIITDPNDRRGMDARPVRVP
ncbi:hypothetical protein vBEliSR6L_15 [Erythrobacter phage vB_EliS_R6L]|nr:hypothetical protein vBEliSR6L_15 [Erythrobacter phage vB_EliS_R6L]